MFRYSLKGIFKTAGKIIWRRFDEKLVLFINVFEIKKTYRTQFDEPTPGVYGENYFDRQPVYVWQ